jgi:TonB family protein
MVPPEFPDILKKGRFEGTVRLSATVAPDGSVSRVEVLGGNPMLARYASEAVMRWKYVPLGAGTVEKVTFDFSPTAH